MEKSHDVLRKAFSDIGVKKVASELGLSSALIYKWCQSPPDEQSLSSGAYNPLDRLYRIYEVTGRLDVIHWLCQRADGFFVKNPIQTEANETNILLNIQKFIKEFSETLKMVSDSYNDDQMIFESDAKKIRQEWEELKRIGEGFVQACEARHFDNEKN